MKSNKDNKAKLFPEEKEEYMINPNSIQIYQHMQYGDYSIQNKQCLKHGNTDYL